MKTRSILFTLVLLLTSPLAARAEDDPAAQPNRRIEPPRVIVPADRPDWIDSQPVLAGDVYRVAVSSEPFVQEAECRQALDESMRKAVDEYIDSQVGQGGAARLVRFDQAYIVAHLVRGPRNPYHEVIVTSVGPMHQSHALLEFDAAFRRAIDERWREVVVASRLARTAALSLGGLVLLGGVWLALRPKRAAA